MKLKQQKRIWGMLLIYFVLVQTRALLIKRQPPALGCNHTKDACRTQKQHRYTLYGNTVSLIVTSDEQCCDKETSLLLILQR